MYFFIEERLLPVLVPLFFHAGKLRIVYYPRGKWKMLFNEQYFTCSNNRGISSLFRYQNNRHFSRCHLLPEVKAGVYRKMTCDENYISTLHMWHSLLLNVWLSNQIFIIEYYRDSIYLVLFWSFFFIRETTFVTSNLLFCPRIPCAKGPTLKGRTLLQREPHSFPLEWRSFKERRENPFCSCLACKCFNAPIWNKCVPF